MRCRPWTCSWASRRRPAIFPSPGRPRSFSSRSRPSAARSRSWKSAPVPDFRLKRQNQLSDVLRALHEAMRVGGLLEREGLEDLGPDLAGLDERPDLFPQVLREIGLELDRARAQ